MKLIVSTFVLGLALVVSGPAAEARVCAAGAHGTHCSSHRRVAHIYHHYHHHHYYHRYSEEGGPVGAPPPYSYYYPPTPAAVFDLPPEPYAANQLQYLMNTINDPPFADTPSYRYYR
ncbi:MAG TPA: hypothetical protein VIJ06_00890 [Methylovirgula sp.]